jgi:hypothetical protein
MNIANPYNYNLPVEPDMFFGRDAEVAALFSRLTAAQGDSIALIGGRRMGKTSMLEALRRILETSTAERSHFLFAPVFVDLSGEAIDSVNDFFHVVYDQAQAELAHSLALPPANVDALSSGQTPMAVFRRLLETWGRAALEQRGVRLRLVLLLDECEEIVDRPWAADLHAVLRALLVGQSTRGLLKVVMAGSHRFLTQVRQRGSPLWNVLVYHMLRVFDEPATRELIVRPTREILAPDVIQEIIDLSGGQPFLTQYLVYHLWEQGVEHVTVDIVQQIAATFHHQRNDFVDWATGLGATGLQIYAILTANAEPLTEHGIQTLLQPPPANLAQALDALCYHGVVARTANSERYQIAGAMFHTWFVNSAPSIPSEHQPDQRRALLEIKQRRLTALELQQAQYGIDAPAHIVLEIEDLKRELDRLSRMAG